VTVNNGGLPATRVLIVDDNRDAAQMLGVLLELHGALVRVEHSCAAALTAIAEFDPRLLLIDLGMPDRDGLDLARELGRQTARARQLLVAVTGWGDSQHRTLSREAGFDLHLVKPVNLPELLEILESCDSLRPA
jgi:two-component system CheB/CheR fusion protein